MFWRVQDMPELAHLGERERGQLLRQATGRAFTIRLVLQCLLRGFLLMFVVMLVVAVVRAGVSPPAPTRSAELTVLLVGLAVWVGGAIGLYQLTLIRIRGQLRAYLIERQRRGDPSPVCLGCGYVLLGQTKQCPECGRPV